MIKEVVQDELWQVVRQYTPDLYLSLLLTPATARPALLCLYALEAELLKIPTRVTQPTLGLVRLVWWRDQIAARNTAQPLLAALAQHWPDDAAALAEFTDSFCLLFEETEAAAAKQVMATRAMLWAALAAKALGAPQPQAYAAAQAHYGLSAEAPRLAVKPLKLLIKLAARRDANRQGWLGDVWTALRIALY